MTTPAKIENTLTLAELKSMVMSGDFSKFSKAQEEQYLELLCKRLGLIWETRPLEFLTLGGKRVLYANKDCSHQLRKLNGISLQVVSEKYDRGLLTVTVHATDKTGRNDEDFGVVPWSEKMAPEFAANIKMKAITKAKRRVTLSISGLGWLDETEVEDIPTEAKAIPTHHQPESGPQMTRVDAKDFCNKLVKAIQGEKTKEEKRLAWDFGAEQRAIVKETWPDIYRDMVDRIKEDAKELGA